MIRILKVHWLTSKQYIYCFNSLREATIGIFCLLSKTVNECLPKPQKSGQGQHFCDCDLCITCTFQIFAWKVAGHAGVIIALQCHVPYLF